MNFNNSTGLSSIPSEKLTNTSLVVSLVRWPVRCCGLRALGVHADSRPNPLRHPGG